MVKRINKLVNTLENAGLKCNFSSENDAICKRKLCSPIYIESTKSKDAINMRFKITKEDTPMEQFSLNKKDDIIIKKPDVMLEIKENLIHYGWNGNKETCDNNKNFNINIKEKNDILNVIFNY